MDCQDQSAVKLLQQRVSYDIFCNALCIHPTTIQCQYMKEAAQLAPCVVCFNQSLLYLTPPSLYCSGVGSNFDVGRPWACQVGGANIIRLT